MNQSKPLQKKSSRKKNKSRPVSRILFPDPLSVKDCGLVFYHLSGPAVACRIYRPTPRHWTSNPQVPVYMVFQPRRWTTPPVTRRTGELLPHLFTLIRQLADGYFLFHYYTLTGIFRLGSLVLCVVRTFLSPINYNGTAIERSALITKLLFFS